MSTLYWTPDLGRRSSHAALLACLGLLIGTAAALLKPWLAGLVVLVPVLLVALSAVAWTRPVWGLVILTVLIPFQFRLPFSKNWSLASGLALTGLLWLLWLCARLAAGEPRVVWTLPFGAALMTFAAGLSLLVAADPVWGMKKLIYLGGFLLLFWIVPNLVRTPTQLQAVTRAIVWAGSATALAGIAQFFAQFYYGPLVLIYIWQHSVAPILEGPHAAEELAANTNWMLWVGHVPVMRALGPFMGPPDAVQFMAICTPLALVGALALRARTGDGGRGTGDGGRETEDGRFSPRSAVAGPPSPVSRPPSPVPGHSLRPLALLPAVGMLIFLALTFARQSWIAALAMFAALLLFGAGYRPFSARMVWITLAVFLVAGTLLAALPTSGIASRVFSIVDRKEISNVQRLQTWGEGIDAVERFPVIGTGVGNFFSAIGAGPGAYAHNAYLDVWAETGPAGLAGLLLLLLWAWSAAISIYRDAREPILRGFGLAAIGSLGWLTVLFCFDDMLYSSRSGPAIWLMLGLLVAARRMLPCTS